MLLTVEKVLILSSVEIFSEIPGDVLVEVSAALKEQEVSAGETIIKKGEFGTSMYIIVSGKVRVHDNGKELSVLGDHDVFGELAALDPENRTASVTALEDTLLLKMRHEALMELIPSSVELARGIIRFLCRRFRKSISAKT